MTYTIQVIKGLLIRFGPHPAILNNGSAN